MQSPYKINEPTVIRRDPSLTDWWAEQEERIGAVFNNRLSYEELKLIATDGQVDMLGDEPEFACYCGD